MPVPPQQAETANFLASLAEGGALFETADALIVRGQDTIWKLRKAIRLTTVPAEATSGNPAGTVTDFTQLDARWHAAQAEMARNAPHAPGYYRDIVAVVRGPEGNLTLGEGKHIFLPPVDWVLRMVRVPDDHVLDSLAAQGKLEPRLLDLIGDAAAAYHLWSPADAGVSTLERLRQQVLTLVRTALSVRIAQADIVAWVTQILPVLDANAALLEARRAAGRVRATHGDLRLGNMVLWRDGVGVVNALEGDPASRTVDNGFDLSRLLLDLELRNGRASACRVASRYVAQTGDTDMLRLLPLFLSLQTIILGCQEAARGHPAPKQYVTLACAYLSGAPPMVVAVGGLPGVGKSTLARALAPSLGRPPGALVLRLDEIHKRLFQVPIEQRLPSAAYDDAANAYVFKHLLKDLRRAVASGQAVIVDTAFIDPAQRAQVAAVAHEAGLPFFGLWLDAPLPELEERLSGRVYDASDATIAKLRLDNIRTQGALDWFYIDAKTPEVTIARSLAVLRLQPLPASPSLLATDAAPPVQDTISA